jgi:ATP-dependent DNA ligase
MKEEHIDFLETQIDLVRKSAPSSIPTSSIFQHACKLGLKGIVSKHRDGAYVKKPERNEWRRA